MFWRWLWLGIGWMALPAAADIYKYVDETGQVYYTDRPKHAGYRLLIRTLKSSPTRSFAPSWHHKMRFVPAIEGVAQKYQLDPKLLHAVVRAESAYNPYAVSPKGAVGLMQLMPETAARYGLYDRYDPFKNLEVGARYLRDLLLTFGDVRLAVAAYNAGEGAVRKYGNRVPPYLETQQYVAKVLEFYKRL
ncbi:MAG: lytic transglycosylase domain-containing protein [Methylohalobius sp.]|nr:lytic transglycosylase domain-containing protein [Methylohalobius sp.]